MFRTLKWIGFGLLGYGTYQSIRHIVESRRDAGKLTSAEEHYDQNRLRQVLDRAEPRGGVITSGNMITGGGRGTTISSDEPSGESIPHQVGRGVIRSRNR